MAHDTYNWQWSRFPRAGTVSDPASQIRLIRRQLPLGGTGAGQHLRGYSQLGGARGWRGRRGSCGCGRRRRRLGGWRGTWGVFCGALQSVMETRSMPHTLEHLKFRLMDSVMPLAVSGSWGGACGAGQSASGGAAGANTHTHVHSGANTHTCA
eukprot:1178352-Prorocentrum_minimum.AAC.6